MWKNQVASSILLSILINHLRAVDLQEPQVSKTSRSILGGPFLTSPLLLSLGYGPVREKKPPKPLQLRGTFVMIRSSPPERPRFYPRNPFPRLPTGPWAPSSFPGETRNRDSLPRMPVTYIVSQPLDFSGSLGDSPGVELSKSDGFTLPPDVTVYHPTDYAKGYLIDAEGEHQELLMGEEKKTAEGDDTEIMVDGESQYFRGNRAPLVFEDHPKNIYEVISTKNDTETAVEAESKKTVEIKVAGGCGNGNSGGEENVDLKVEKLQGDEKNNNEVKKRLDFVVIGQQLCR